VKVITLKDRALFEKYLRAEEHELAEYAFQDIYIWKGLFDIRWKIIRGCLCVFFSDSCGSFLYLPPLGPCSPEAVKEAFAQLDSLNKNPALSRIENVEERGLGFFSRLGYRHNLRGQEYICSREEMASLRGDRFKSKRASVNYFASHNRFEYVPFSAAHADGCIGLYKEWMAERAAGSAGKHDSVYRGMLADGLKCLATMLGGYERLGMEGAVLFAGGEMAAFTFGYPLNSGMFCVLFEVAHPRFKGAPQFIFRNFCAGRAGYETVNIMDDSGLENLKRVKMSYRPRRLAPAYIVNAS
jgi:hypothetical protein